MRNSYCVKVLRYSVSSIKWGIPAHSATKSSYSIHLQRGNNVAAQTQYLISNPLICVIFFFKYLFIYGCAESLPPSGFFFRLQCTVFSLWWFLLLQSTGFRSCSTWAQQLWLPGSRAQALQLWSLGPSCYPACGSYLDQGLNPSLPLAGRSFTREAL